jgi:hypothetical protein
MQRGSRYEFLAFRDGLFSDFRDSNFEIRQQASRSWRLGGMKIFKPLAARKFAKPLALLDLDRRRLAD